MLPLSIYYFFFFTDPAPTEIYTLSLHDALPILLRHAPGWQARSSAGNRRDPPRRSNRTATRQASAERADPVETSARPAARRIAEWLGPWAADPPAVPFLRAGRRSAALLIRESQGDFRRSPHGCLGPRCAGRVLRPTLRVADGRPRRRCPGERCARHLGKTGSPRHRFGFQAG